MINLSNELEAHAEGGADGAQLRLADPGPRELLHARLARARRRANITIALGVAAVVGLSASALAMPNDPIPPGPGPSPSPSVTVHIGRLPAIDTAGYLVHLRGAHHTDEALTCDMIRATDVSPDEVDYPGTMPPLPTWIEANRIYGLDDGLPPNYPIPLYSRDDSMFYKLAVSEISQLYPDDVEVVLALIAPDGSWWGFDADYSVVDAMPFDAPGLFVALTPDPLCNGGPRAVDRSRIPPGHYNARLMVVRNDGRFANAITDYGDIEIVTGLPSIPELNVTQ